MAAFDSVRPQSQRDTPRRSKCHRSLLIVSLTTATLNSVRRKLLHNGLELGHGFIVA